MSYEPNPVHTYSGEGIYSIKVIATNNTGCRDSSNAFVRVHPKPNSDFMLLNGTEQVYSELEQIDLQNRSAGAIRYLWDFGNGDVSQSFEPHYQYQEPGFYNITLSVMNSFGCTDILAKRVEVIVPEQIFVPNAFTPNGDSKNDYFTVAYNNIEQANIKIFNRWGELIFESNDLHFRWNGDFENRIVQNEVYVYLIDAVGYYGTQISKSGKITVLH
jgi:gliding motility-associated-like protein